MNTTLASYPTVNSKAKLRLKRVKKSVTGKSNMAGQIVKAQIRPARIFDADVPLNGQVFGPIGTWPWNMRDAIYEAMEKLMRKHGVKELEIIQSVCMTDGKSYWAHITVMEKLGPEDVVVMTIQ